MVNKRQPLNHIAMDRKRLKKLPRCKHKAFVMERKDALATKCPVDRLAVGEQLVELDPSQGTGGQNSVQFYLFLFF